MGEIAEMMVDGILCQGCGVYLDMEDPNGYPTSCSDCKEGEEQEQKPSKSGSSKRRFRKRVRKELVKFPILLEESNWIEFISSYAFDQIEAARDQGHFKKTTQSIAKDYIKCKPLTLST